MILNVLSAAGLLLLVVLGFNSAPWVATVRDESEDASQVDLEVELEDAAVEPGSAGDKTMHTTSGDFVLGDFEGNLLLMSEKEDVEAILNSEVGEEKVEKVAIASDGVSGDAKHMEDHVVVFGVQYLVKRYLEGEVVDDGRVKDFREVCMKHQLLKNEPDCDHVVSKWSQIVLDCQGKLPVRIFAKDEGSVVKHGEPIIIVDNGYENDVCKGTNFPWLPKFLSKLLLQIWYPVTIASNSHALLTLIKASIDVANERMGGGEQGLPRLMMHDFGYRGVSSSQTAAVGGGAHMLSFDGSDTVSGVQWLREYYNSKEDEMPVTSVPATEHSVMTSFTRFHEFEGMKRILAAFPYQGNGAEVQNLVVAQVIDSFNMYRFVALYYHHLHCTHKDVKSELLSESASPPQTTRGCYGPGYPDFSGIFTLRPDSGDAEVNPIALIELVLEAKSGGFKPDLNTWKMLPPGVKVLQGDGISYDSTKKILEVMLGRKNHPINIIFGSGGGLLQKWTRNSLQVNQRPPRDGEVIDGAPVFSGGVLHKETTFTQIKSVLESAAKASITWAEPAAQAVQAVDAWREDMPFYACQSEKDLLEAVYPALKNADDNFTTVGLEMAKKMAKTGKPSREAKAVDLAFAVLAEQMNPATWKEGADFAKTNAAGFGESYTAAVKQYATDVASAKDIIFKAYDKYSDKDKAKLADRWNKLFANRPEDWPRQFPDTQAKQDASKAAGVGGAAVKAVSGDDGQADACKAQLERKSTVGSATESAMKESSTCRDFEKYPYGFEENIALMSDSYKISHWKMYYPDMTQMTSYVEARGVAKGLDAVDKKVVFFGLQYILKRYLAGPVVTAEKVEYAIGFWAKHLNSDGIFNAYGVDKNGEPYGKGVELSEKRLGGWMDLAKSCGGHLPIKISAVKEGKVVETRQPLVVIRNLDDTESKAALGDLCEGSKFPWLTNYLETILLHVWLPVTIASNSYSTDWAKGKADHGFAGVSSMETAAVGGGSHYLGRQADRSENLAAIQFLRQYYNLQASERVASSGQEGWTADKDEVTKLLQSFTRDSLKFATKAAEVKRVRVVDGKEEEFKTALAKEPISDAGKSSKTMEAVNRAVGDMTKEDKWEDCLFVAGFLLKDWNFDEVKENLAR